MYNSITNVSTSPTDLPIYSLQKEENSTCTSLTVTDVVILLTNLSAIAANVAIVVAILKSKLWKLPIYVFILNWSLLHLCHFITSPGVNKWYMTVEEFYLGFMMRSIFFGLSNAFAIGIVILLFVLLLNSGGFKGNYLKIIRLVWLNVLFLCVLVVLGGIWDPIILSIAITYSFSVYAGFLIINFIICVIFHYKRANLSSKNHTLILTLITIYVSFWFMFLLVTIASVCMVIFILEKGAVLLFYGFAETTALVNVYVLIKSDDLFAMSFGGLLFWKTQESERKLDISQTIHTVEVTEFCNNNNHK